jgi:hypothetical protein
MKDKKYAAVSQEDLELVKRTLLLLSIDDTDKALKIINRAIERASDPVIWARLTNNGELWDRRQIRDLPDGEYNFCVCPTGEEP